MTQDDLRLNAERAAELFAREELHRGPLDDVKGTGRYAGYVAGYLAAAKEAEALVEVLQWVERWAQAFVSERNVAVLEKMQEALARYRGGAK